MGGLDACQNVWDYLITANEGDWSSLLCRSARIALSASIVGVVTTTTASSGRLAPLLSWCEHGDCWGATISLICGLGPKNRLARILVQELLGSGQICRHHCKLLEHAIIIVALGLVGGDLLH